MTNAKDGAWWFGWFYQGAAVYAGAIGQVPAAALFGGKSLFFQGASQGIGHRLEQASNNRCEQVTKEESMTMDIMPTVKYSSFMVLCWVVGVLTTNLILDDLAYWWATIPAVALLGFTGYLVLRVKINREQCFLAMLIAIMVTRAVKQLSL